MYFSLILKRAHVLQRPRLHMTSLFGIIQLNFNSVATASVHIIISVCKFMRLVILTCQTSMERYLPSTFSHQIKGFIRSALVSTQHKTEIRTFRPRIVNIKAVRRYLINIIVVARSLNYQNEKPALFKQSQKVRHNCTKHRSNL